MKTRGDSHRAGEMQRGSALASSETQTRLESNEHDYANPAKLEPDSTPVTPSVSCLKEDPDTNESAEVDGPGGSSNAETNASDPDRPVQFKGAVRAMRRTQRPEDKNCSCCKMLFQRQGRSFNRRAVFTFTTVDTVHWVFPESTVTEKSFLCETCAQVIRTRGRRKQCGKRPLWVRPPTHTKVKDKLASSYRLGKRGTAALLVNRASYKSALRMLWSAKGARKHMMDFFCKQLKIEMKLLSRQADSPFHLKVSGRKPLSSFPWRRCVNWAQGKAPLVGACLQSMFPDVNAFQKSSHQMSEEQAVSLLERRTVLALSIPLFTRNNWRNNFLQAALGAELRLQGCSGSALDTLNAMGLCQNKDTVRLLLHRLGNSNNVDGDQGMVGNQEQIKDETGELMTDEQESEEEDKEGEDLEEDGEMLIAVEEEVEQEEVQDAIQEEDEEPEVKMIEAKRRRRKKTKKDEKRKGRAKRKTKEDQVPVEEGEEEQQQQQKKKKKVVVVRLDLLKGRSEVGRSDLSAP